MIPFLQDLTSSLKASGIECEVPPIVYEQVGHPGGGVVHGGLSKGSSRCVQGATSSKALAQGWGLG